MRIKGRLSGINVKKELERDIGSCLPNFEFIAQYGNLFFFQKNMYLLFKNTVNYLVYCKKKKTETKQNKCI